MSNSENLLLLLVQGLCVLSAAVVTFHPNILHAAVGLLMTFFCVSVLFLFAGADFLAAAQIVIYVGGITILILFAIMLTRWMYQMKLRDLRWKLLIPMVVVFVSLVPFLWKIIKQIDTLPVLTLAEDAAKFDALPKTKLMGDALLNAYLMPFEVITVLLLAALVGAVWLARPRYEGDAT